MNPLEKYLSEFKGLYPLPPEAGIALTAFSLFLERKVSIMVSTEMLRAFTTVRALIFASSPQVEDRDGHLVILDEHGKVYTIVAKLAGPDSFERLRNGIINNPQNISLVVLPDRPLPERYAIAERVSIYHAYMLT